MRSFADAAQVLGHLELKLMGILWDARSPMSVRAVLTRFRRATPAYTTVMTTLDRLYKKHLLLRVKQGNAFAYRAALDYDDYRRRVVAAALGPLLKERAGPVLSAFVDIAARADAKHLVEIERLIAAHRSRF